MLMNPSSKKETSGIQTEVSGKTCNPVIPASVAYAPMSSGFLTAGRFCFKLNKER